MRRASRCQSSVIKNNMIEWPAEKVRQLILEVELRRSLWDPRDVDYKDRYKKRDLFNEISQKLNTPQTECERKWSNVKTQFNRELANIRKTQNLNELNVAENVFTSKWIFFDCLKFLIQVTKPRNRILRMDDNSSEGEQSLQSQFQNFEFVPSEKIIQRAVIDDFLEQDFVDHGRPNLVASSFIKTEEACASPRTSVSPTTSVFSQNGSAAKRKHVIQPSPSNSTLNTTNNTCTAFERKGEPDDLDIFGQYVASECRGVTDPKKLILLKKKITDAIFYTKIAILEENQTDLV